MRALTILVAASLLAGCGTSYRRPILGMAGGYSDKQISPGYYKVVFGTNAYASRGFALNAALYRAAEITKRDGFSHFQIVDANFVVQYFTIGYGYAPAAGGGGMYGGEGVTFWIRLANDADAPIDCQSSKKGVCQTFDATQVLEQLQPIVKPKRKKG